jgi:hypothetical protein
MTLADLRSIVKDSIVEGKVIETGLDVKKIKPRETSIEKKKTTIKMLSEIPFKEFSKQKGSYFITIDKESTLNDENIIALSEISQFNDYFISARHDKHDKDNFVLMISNDTNLLSEESKSI